MLLMDIAAAALVLCSYYQQRPRLSPMLSHASGLLLSIHHYTVTKQRHSQTGLTASTRSRRQTFTALCLEARHPCRATRHSTRPSSARPHETEISSLGQRPSNTKPLHNTITINKCHAYVVSNVQMIQIAVDSA